MIHPFLSVLVAGSIQLAAETPRPVDLAEIVIELTEIVQAAHPEPVTAAEEITVRDVRYYYDILRPLPVPVAPLIVSYDWRLPIIFDLP